VGELCPIKDGNIFFAIVIGSVINKVKFRYERGFGTDRTLSYVWCVDSPEVKEHLFGKCGFASAIWYKLTLFKWLGVILMVPGREPIYFAPKFYFHGWKGEEFKSCVDGLTYGVVAHLKGDGRSYI